MKKTFKWKIGLLVVCLFSVTFTCSMFMQINTATAHSCADQTKIVQLNRVDSSGVYALPEGACVDTVLLDGEPAKYVLVKDGTEVDVWAARPNSVVEAVIYQ